MSVNEPELHVIYVLMYVRPLTCSPVLHHRSSVLGFAPLERSVFPVGGQMILFFSPCFVFSEWFCKFACRLINTTPLSFPHVFLSVTCGAKRWDDFFNHSFVMFVCSVDYMILAFARGKETASCLFCWLFMVLLTHKCSSAMLDITFSLCDNKDATMPHPCFHDSHWTDSFPAATEKQKQDFERLRGFRTVWGDGGLLSKHIATTSVAN